MKPETPKLEPLKRKRAWVGKERPIPPMKGWREVDMIGSGINKKVKEYQD
jgi:hypothetical protein